MAAVNGGLGGSMGRWTIVLAIGLFTLLTVLFTYPISTSPGSYLNHLTDPRLVTYTMAWNAHAFATDPLGIFHPNIYFPDPGTKASSETFLLPSLLVAPLNWAGHPVLAYNLVLLTSFVLGGLGAMLWVRHMTGSLNAGLVAGMIWAFAPGKFDQIAHLHMMLGVWVPFVLLYLGRYLEEGRARDLYATGVLIVVQAGFSMHYGAYLAPLVGLYALGLLALLPRSALRSNLSRYRRQLTIAAVAVALLVVAVALPYWWTHDQVGLQRNYREVLGLSAEPASFLSGSINNKAPHVVWLYERFRVEDASFLPGVVPYFLAAFALLALVPAALRATRATAGDIRRRPGGWARARFWMQRLAAAGAAVMFGLHFAGLAAAGADGGWAELVRSLSLAIHPALWAAVALTFALLLRGRSAGTARDAYLMLTAYLTAMFYLLAYGPEVQASGVQLGHGPYWLLYQFFLPFRIIRSAGRIGLVWLLCVAALAGFGLAGLERRWASRVAARPHGSPRRSWAVVMAVLLVVLVWEFHTWPVRHLEADPAADPADVWLAEQPGDFAVVHVPIGRGDTAPLETAYMLGSTLHWKKLVNGYLRFAPFPYRDLAATEQLGAEFFRQLRAGFPVRYLLVHEDLLADDAQRQRLQRLLASGDDARFVTQLGYTQVFEVPQAGRTAGTAPDEGTWGLSFERAFSSEDLRGAAGARLSLRASPLAGSERIVALAGWPGHRQVIEVTEEWREVRIPAPPMAPGPPAADPGPFELRGHVLRPVGETDDAVIAGFTIEAGRRGAVIGVGGRIFDEDRRRGVLVHRLARYGHRALETRRFVPTPTGAERMLAYVRDLPEGALVAVSVRHQDFRALDADVVSALRLLGVAPGDQPVLLLVAVGVRGAAPGMAPHSEHHLRAFIDIEAPTPVLQVRDLSLY